MTTHRAFALSALLTVLSSCGDSEPAGTSGDGGVSGENLPEEIGAATGALSEAASAMAEVTTELANSGASTASTSAGMDDTPDMRRQAASEVAEMTAQSGSGCITSETTLTPLSVTLTYANCTLTSGREVNGTIRFAIQSWSPLELSFLLEDLSMGDNRYWAGGTLAFPRMGDDGPIEPVLNGAVAVVSPDDVFALEGNIRFEAAQSLFSGSLDYLTGSELNSEQQLVFRPGQTGVDASVTNLVIERGSCAPSSGNGQFLKYTITGITGGGTETTDADALIFTEDVRAQVTFLATTPADGLVQVQLGSLTFPYMLSSPCAP